MNFYREIFLIIDPQFDFTHDEGEYSKRHRGISQIKSALKKIELNAKNLQNIPSILVYSEYEENQFEEGLSICISNTFGNQINFNLNIIDLKFKKKFHNVFSSIEFTDFVEKNNIESIYFSGFFAEYCIYHSILDSIDRNIKAIIVEDVIGTGDDVQVRKENLFEVIKERNVSIISSVVLINKDRLSKFG